MRNKRITLDASRRQLLQLAAIGAVTALLPACGNQTVAKGDRFPDVALPDLDGRITPFSAYSDVALVVNFWATWCEPCRREMPALEKLSTLFRPGDLRVIGVAVDSDVNLPREFGMRYKLTFPVLSDSNQAVTNGILRIPGFPATYLLRRDRTIARIVIGAQEWAEPKMLAEIEALLAVRRISAV